MPSISERPTTSQFEPSSGEKTGISTALTDINMRIANLMNTLTALNKQECLVKARPISKEQSYPHVFFYFDIVYSPHCREDSENEIDVIRKQKFPLLEQLGLLKEARQILLKKVK